MRDLIWLASQAISHTGYFYGVVCTVKKKICSFYNIILAAVVARIIL